MNKSYCTSRYCKTRSRAKTQVTMVTCFVEVVNVCSNKRIPRWDLFNCINCRDPFFDFYQYQRSTMYYTFFYKQLPFSVQLQVAQVRPPTGYSHGIFLFKWVVQVCDIIISCLLATPTQFYLKCRTMNPNLPVIVQKTLDMVNRYIQTIIVKNIEKNGLCYF